MKTKKSLIIILFLAILSFASISAFNIVRHVNAEKARTNENIKNNVVIKNNEKEVKIGDEIKVHFLNINKLPGTSIDDVGDCVLIQDHGVNILIDSGKSNECSDQFENYDDESITYEIDYLRKNGVEHLDYVINTHLHEDHAGALEKMIQEFTVKKAVIVRELDWSNLISYEINVRRLYFELKEVTERQLTEDGNQMHLTEPVEGESGRIYISDESYMEFYFLPLSEQKPDEEINHTSVMVYYVYKDFKVLVTGDADSRLNSHLVQNGIGHTQIFQAQHHTASKGARGEYNSQELLDLITPDICVIQANRTEEKWFADNDTFGNLLRLKNSEITSYSTAVTGSICITSDGSSDGYKIEFETSSTPLVQGKWGK